MSSELQQRFESLQREFNAYTEHIMTQAPQSKAKSRKKQEPVAIPPPVVVSLSLAPKKRGRKHKLEEAAVAAPVAC